MSDVRAKSGAQVVADFASVSGTPIVVDVVGKTLAILDSTGAVVRLGCTTVASGMFSATASLTFGTIAANGIAEQTITVTGAAVNDTVIAGAPATLEAGLTFSAFVSAANTVTIRLHNNSGGSITPAAATWRATVIDFT